MLMEENLKVVWAKFFNFKLGNCTAHYNLPESRVENSAQVLSLSMVYNKQCLGPKRVFVLGKFFMPCLVFWDYL